MKKTKLLILLGVMPMLALQAQQPCIPMWPDTGYGIKPDTIENLPVAVVGQPYEAVAQFKVPDTTIYNNNLIAVYQVALVGILGLADIPASVPFSYACNPPSCVFFADSVGCVRITGTPTLAGTYPLIIQANVFLTPVLYIPFPTPGYRIVVQEDVGVTQQSSQQSVTLFPNPADALIAIRIPKEPARLLTASFYDIQGRLIRQETWNGSATTNQWLLDVSTLDAGIYFIAIQWEEGAQVVKLVKS
ncbi:MAG: T9SS type A sorting domain-containing protein [Chitinophagales bacterium]|nr:T9SS type A sorting domain-containing protein [Chitinophagales bacterium]MDW8427732.1 T9SS type A sorting domain-containing protein [Chitinophagales bacterium]